MLVGNDHYFFLACSVFDKVYVVRFDRAYLIDEEIVIDGLERDEHECEISVPSSGFIAKILNSDKPR